MKGKKIFGLIVATLASLVGAVFTFPAFATLSSSATSSEPNGVKDGKVRRYIGANWKKAEVCLVHQPYHFDTEEELEYYLVNCIAQAIRDEQIKTAVVFRN